MAAIRPLPLGVIEQRWADEVPSPPHDALSADQRRDHLNRHPLSYLGVTRAPEDASPGMILSPEQLLAQAQEQLDRLLEAEVFRLWPEPAYFMYRLTIDGHSQTGLVCGVSVDDYDSGTVRIHERIKADRADHLARHLDAIKAQSSPIALGIHPSTGLGRWLESPGGAEALVDVVTNDGLHQQVWAITDPATITAIDEAVEQAPLYLVDGHHRAAAASTHRQNRSITDPGSPFSSMLAVIFPLDQLNSKAFHRVVNGLEDRDAFVNELTSSFPARRVDDPRLAADRAPAEIAVSIGDGQWILLSLPLVDADGNPAAVIANLDPVRLNLNILQPRLEIDESNPDGRLSYVPGFDDAATIEQLQARPGEMVFIMRPVSMDELIATADAGLVMPPKSTYFEPKVRSGIFLDQKR